MDRAELSKRSFTVSDVSQAPGELSPKACGNQPHGDSIECICSATEEGGALFAVAAKPSH